MKQPFLNLGAERQQSLTVTRKTERQQGVPLKAQERRPRVRLGLGPRPGPRSFPTVQGRRLQTP